MQAEEDSKVVGVKSRRCDEVARLQPAIFRQRLRQAVHQFRARRLDFLFHRFPAHPAVVVRHKPFSQDGDVNVFRRCLFELNGFHFFLFACKIMVFSLVNKFFVK